MAAGCIMRASWPPPMTATWGPPTADTVDALASGFTAAG